MFDFDKVINRYGTYCTQWDFVQDRFSEKDLLPFSISDTDFEVPNVVYDDLKKRLDHRIFGYTRWNHCDFKMAIAHHYKKRFHLNINQDAIVYSPSVMYSVSLLIRLMSSEGDSVLVFDPMYDAFINVIQKNNRKLIACPLNKNKHFSIDWNLFEKQAKKCKILLLCSPHNPTGRVFTEQENEEIVRICKQNNIFIISDEIHSDVVFEGNKHHPILQFKPLYENMALVSSASKTFNIPGLGGSFAIISKLSLIEKFLVQTRQIDFVNSANTMGMLALISAYEKADDYIDALIMYVEENMNLLDEFLKNNFKDISFSKPQATYLAWIDMRNVPFSDNELQSALVSVGKIGIMSGGVYGENGERYLRWNIGCPKAKLQEGLKRFKKAMDYLYEGKTC